MADSAFKINKGVTLNPQSSIPTSPTSGDVYYDATLSTFVFYNNGKWINLASQVDVASAALLNSVEFTAAVVQNPLVRITGATTSNLYGMTASTGGHQIIIYNESISTLTIYSDNPSEPIPANRFIANVPSIAITAGDCIIVVYDDVQNRWVVASNPNSSTPPVTPPLWVAQEIPLTVGTTTQSVAFTIPQLDTSYVVFPMVENLIDPTPQYIQVEVTQKTTGGFSVTWNAPLDTANYIISFVVPPRWFTYAETVIGASQSSVNVTFPFAQATSSYPVIGMLQNLADANPQFQSLIVGAQSTAGATFDFNAPTSSANYQVAYMLNGSAQTAVGSGQTSATITLPVDYGTSSYGIVVTAQNLVDVNPQFQPLVVTAKTTNSVTVSWNVPTLTSNNVLTAYAISITT